MIIILDYFFHYISLYSNLIVCVYICTHNIVFFLILGYLVIYYYIKKKKKKLITTLMNNVNMFIVYFMKFWPSFQGKKNYD